jgi:hypothetical protein
MMIVIDMLPAVPGVLLGVKDVDVKQLHRANLR